MGASAILRISFTVGSVSTGTIYNNQATATGAGPNNTTTTDLSDNGTNPDPDGDGNPNEDDANNRENDPTPLKFSEAPAIGIAKVVGAVKKTAAPLSPTT